MNHDEMKRLWQDPRSGKGVESSAIANAPKISESSYLNGQCGLVMLSSAQPSWSLDLESATHSGWYPLLLDQS